MSTETYPRKLAAIFYADVAGYTSLMERHETDAHRRAMAVLQEVSRAIEAANGVVLRYGGDAILAEFSSIVVAVQTSISIQRELAVRGSAVHPDNRVEIRIGVNLGDVIIDRGELYGEGVNLAARLEAAAIPGGICISDVVYQQVSRKIHGATFIDGGVQSFKNISTPLQVFQWHPDERRLATVENTTLTQSSSIDPKATVTCLAVSFPAIARSTNTSTGSEPERHIAQQVTDAHGGRLFAVDDRILNLEFTTPDDAVAASLALMKAATALSPTDACRLSAGIHTGPAAKHADAIAALVARHATGLMHAAQSGQILVSDTTAALLSEIQLTGLGLHRLRDLGQAERLWQLGDEEFPSPRVSSASDVRLPEDVTSFIGRQAEVESLSNQVNRERLTTLLGPGGIGKTRLALRTAWHVQADFPGGVWFCNLVDAHDEDDSLHLALCDAAGVRRREGRSLLETMVEWIGSRHALVVLDNCEHVVGPAGRMVATLIARCQSLHVLATSRVPLRIAAETRQHAGPLDAQHAYQLFAERLQSFKPGSLGEGRDRDVERLCAVLGGMPLAIELVRRALSSR